MSELPFTIFFPISQVTTSIFLPPLISFCISFFTSMAGLSGAFLLLPVMMSFFGFSSVSVTATSFLYNAVGIPGGVARFVRERRMVWPLAAAMAAGTLPGVLVGYWFRVQVFPDPRAFKLFVGLVLLFMAVRLWVSRVTGGRGGSVAGAMVGDLRYGFSEISFTFREQAIVVNVPLLVGVSFVVGVLGGIYGIGGGALLIPFCVSFLGIPLYVVAGAGLFSTFLASLAGVAVYSLVSLGGKTAPPDWLLGCLFGLGGFAGMNLGVRLQKHVPEQLIRRMLCVLLFFVAGRYVVQYFF